MFICTDATTGENVWTNVGAGTGDIEPFAFQGTSYGYNMGGSSGYSGGWIQTNVIQKYSLTSDGNGTDVSNATVTRRFPGGGLSETHGYSAGGHSGDTGVTGDEIDKFSFASGTDATDVGNLTTATWCVGQSSITYNYCTRGGLATDQRKIEKYATASDGDASDIANLSFDHNSMHAGCSSDTYGYTAGGVDHAENGKPIDKFSFSSDGDATGVGNLTAGGYGSFGTSSTTHGYALGGYRSAAWSNIIEKWSFSSDEDASDVGNLTVATGECNNASSSTTFGYVAGGYTSTGAVNTIQKHSFSSDGDATDVGDLFIQVHNSASTQI
jgi:hypothetical protein